MFKYRHSKSIETLEKLEVESTLKKCINCAYRERHISYCWYTMITNKINKIENNKCKHYVDIIKLLKQIQKDAKE